MHDNRPYRARLIRLRNDRHDYPEHRFDNRSGLLHPMGLILLLWALLWALPALTQVVPPACCFDATCVYCEDVAACENSPYWPEMLAVSGGMEVCGIDTPTPCTSWTENNVFGGDCLPSCNDEAACNYDPVSPSTLDCTYPEPCADCSGTCFEDVNENLICDCLETFGCTDGASCNYAPEADADDGSCTYPELGYNCDGSCSDADGDGVCLLDELHGCTDSLAINFYPFITEEDSSCVYAEDFAPDCEVACPDDCPADVNGDGDVTVGDILTVLSLFGFACPR